MSSYTPPLSYAPAAAFECAFTYAVGAFAYERKKKLVANLCMIII